MELQFENKTCRYLRQNLREVKQQEQTQELRLPDGMPDIGNILGGWGQCVMRSKEWNADHVSASGGVMAWILYAPADGTQPRVVETWLPVQLKWNMAGAQRAGTIRCSWLLRGVDGRTLSARKMMVRANVSVLAEAMEPWEQDVAFAEQVPEDVQLLKNTYPARLNMEAGEKTFLMDEELPLPEPKPEKLISFSMTPWIAEQKVLGGKAVMRGHADFRMLYQDADGRLHRYAQKLEFSQFADLDRDYDKDAQMGTMMAISSLEPELQEERLRLKCGLIAQYLISDVQMLELIEDAYSPVRQVNLQSKELRLPMVLDSRQGAACYSCNIPEKAAQLVDVSVNMEQPEIRRAGDLTEAACSGQVQVLFYDENGVLQGRTGRWNGEWELPVSADADVLGEVQGIGEPEVMTSGDQISINGEISLDADTISRQELTMVTAMELGQQSQPDPNRPSLILRRAGDGSLWEIAKDTGSTINAICAANGLNGEPLDDRLLLIPVS